MESDRRERIVSINSFTNSLFSIAGHLWDGLESNKCKYISLWWKFHTLTHERYQSCSVNGREKHLHRKFSLNREIVLKTPFLCQWRSWAAGFSKNEQLSTHIFSVMRRYRTRVSELVSKTVEPTWLMWPWWVKIPTEDFTDETLAIDDTQGVDARVRWWLGSWS